MSLVGAVRALRVDSSKAQPLFVKVMVVTVSGRVVNVRRICRLGADPSVSVFLWIFLGLLSWLKMNIHVYFVLPCGLRFWVSAARWSAICR